MAPELAQGLPYTEKCGEIYAFGALMSSIENRNGPRPHRTLQPPGMFADVMGSCLSVDPSAGPTAYGLVLVSSEKARTRRLRHPIVLDAQV
jgi:hypothetical protein